tara:strand:- start:1256 stop:2617 length:1362 start_codon:yes stop_codon:yes gene_type:complete
VKNKFDLIVIGAGSGGLAAAKRAATYGANVAIIEGDQIGGTCVIRGCVPKKLMVYAANERSNIINSEGNGLIFNNPSFDSSILLKNIKKEVKRLSDLHYESLKKLDIKVFQGWGRFKDSNSVEIICPKTNNLLNTLKSEKFLIAVGGKPKSLDIAGAEFAWSSNEIFDLNKFPKSLLIVGGGYIACEFACIFNNLGTKVTQLIRSNKLLNGFDSDLSISIKEAMESSGINLIFKDELVSISKENENLDLIFKSGFSKKEENVLIASGREPNFSNLNIDSLDINMNGGFIEVNGRNQTSQSRIFAIGDVIDKPNLTPVAIEQGRVFSDNNFGKQKRSISYKFIPKAVFTCPEISSVGLSEEEARNIYTNENIKVFKCKFTPMSNTFKRNKSKCMLKLVVNKIDDKVLGCHMFGESASEIIQMASISLNKGVTKKEFDETMALHPTISEEFVTMY